MESKSVLPISVNISIEVTSIVHLQINNRGISKQINVPLKFWRQQGLYKFHNVRTQIYNENMTIIMPTQYSCLHYEVIILYNIHKITMR